MAPLRLVPLVPPLPDLAALERLPVESLAELRRQATYLLADVTELLDRRRAAPLASGPGDVLSIEAAAARLATSKRALYHKHKRLGLGYIDPLDNRLKFSASELDAYVRRRK